MFFYVVVNGFLFRIKIIYSYCAQGAAAPPPAVYIDFLFFPSQKIYTAGGRPPPRAQYLIISFLEAGSLQEDILPQMMFLRTSRSPPGIYGAHLGISSLSFGMSSTCFRIVYCLEKRLYRFMRSHTVPYTIVFMLTLCWCFMPWLIPVYAICF